MADDCMDSQRKTINVREIWTWGAEEREPNSLALVVRNEKLRVRLQLSRYDVQEIAMVLWSWLHEREKWLDQDRQYMQHGKACST